MILQYIDIFKGGKEKNIEAEITTDHPASHYGLPAVVLPDGNALNPESWILLNYKILKCTQEEAGQMERWLKNLYAMFGIQENPAAALGRKGGSAKSDKKAVSSRENGKLGGRPKLRK